MVRNVLLVEDTAPRLSVGFVNAALADLQAADFLPRAMRSASQLRSGDAALADGVRVKVHGLVRSEAAGTQPVSMGLDAMYRVAGHAEEVPFMAWSYAQMANRQTGSAASSFVVPVGAKSPLSLSLFTSAVVTSGTISKGKSPKLQASVKLALGSERRTNKLRSGLYFLAMTPAGVKAPDWASVHVVPSTGNLPLLKQATLLGVEPVSFDYVIVSIDRA
jgi:hypothetical protein